MGEMIKFAWSGPLLTQQQLLVTQDQRTLRSYKGITGVYDCIVSRSLGTQISGSIVEGCSQILIENVITTLCVFLFLGNTTIGTIC